MQKIISFLTVSIILVAFAACSGKKGESAVGEPAENAAGEFQGIYEIDRVALKEMMAGEVANNPMALAMLDGVVNAAHVEIKVSEDSVIGVMQLLGESRAFRGHVDSVNDSLAFSGDGVTGYLVPNDKGLLFKQQSSKMGMQLIRLDTTELSAGAQAILSGN